MEKYADKWPMQSSIVFKTKNAAFNAAFFVWGNRGGSNPRPSESQSDALTN